MRGSLRHVLAVAALSVVAAFADQEPPGLRRVVMLVHARVGASRAIAVEFHPSAHGNVTLAVVSSDPAIVAVPETVEALDGAPYAFVPIRPVGPGHARVTVSLGEDSTACEVLVSPAAVPQEPPTRPAAEVKLDPSVPPLVLEAEDTPDPANKETLAPVVERDGKKVRSQYSSNQYVDWTCEVPRTGFYQFFVTGCCDFFLDAPRCGVVLGGKGEPIAQGPIASAHLERVAIGDPVKLEKGPRALSFRFLNDAYDPETHLDRNQYIDRMEVAWVGDAAPDGIPPEVALLEPLRAEAGGPVDVHAEARDAGGVAEMRLYVNDSLIATVYGARLARRVALPVGSCRLRVEAQDVAGNVAQAGCDIVRLPFDGPPVAAAEVIGASEAKGIAPQEDPSSPTGARLDMYSSEPTATFAVYADHDGEVVASVLARADLYKGAPRAEIAVNGQKVSAEVTSTGYDEVFLGKVHLAAGDNVVTLRFPNDAYGGTPQTDRNLIVAGVAFAGPATDEAPPRVDLVNVPPVVSGVELIMARASDNAGVERVELLVDGVSTGAVDRVEPFGMWLDTERLPVGKHSLSARVRDAAENEATSAEAEVEVVRASHTSPLSTTERGIQLLNRLGLGYSREALEGLLLLREDAWLQRELALNDDTSYEASAFEPVGNDYGRLLLATIAHATHARAEVRERLALFWDNHFSTFVQKTNSQSEWNEFGRFRRLALGRFRDLLGASAHSATMLTYLDNQQNRKGHPNENYAREIMELHTLGVHGGYTQRDVEQVTRVLTGWAADAGGDRFAYVPQFHDGGEKHALGLRFPTGAGREEGEWLLDVLSAHPSTAKFVCGKLAALWVTDDPSPDLVGGLALQFQTTGGNIASVVRQAVAQPEFFDRKNFATKVKDPLELVFGMTRQGAPTNDLWAIDRSLVRLARRFYDCQPPTGYKERAEEWLNSANLLTRWNLAEETSQRIPLARVFPGGWEGRTAEVLTNEAALSLIGRLLAPDRRQIVLDAVDGMEGDARVRAIIALVMQMPEYQMN